MKTPESNGWFTEGISILPNPLKWLGHILMEGCSMHQLASHGDHQFNHDAPLDLPVEPVTSLPGEQI